MKFCAAGDLVIQENLPPNHPGLPGIRDWIGGADVRIVNLEVPIVDEVCYGSTFSGAPPLSVKPYVIDVLRRYGFQACGCANNHTLDYGIGGLQQTMHFLDRGGILRAGIGNCLHEASAPASIPTDGGRVAYIAQSACYWENDSMRAGYPYWDVPGRPGMNGLRHIEECLVTKEEMAFIKDLAQRTLVNAENDIEAALGYGFLEDDTFSFGTVKFRESEQTGRFSRVNETDMQRTEQGIRDAKHSHEYCVVSLHCHQFRAREEHETDYYLEEYAHRCIDAGADAVVGTGTHMPKAIEIYKGRPIFYCLGNFMFQSEYAKRYTADFVESRGYPLSMTPAQVHARQNSEATHFMQDFPIYYMGILPRWEMEGDRLTKIELMAVELGFGAPFGLRGFPSPMDAERLREHMEMVCAPYGTKLNFRDGIIEVLL